MRSSDLLRSNSSNLKVCGIHYYYDILLFQLAFFYTFLRVLFPVHIACDIVSYRVFTSNLKSSIHIFLLINLMKSFHNTRHGVSKQTYD